MSDVNLAPSPTPPQGNESAARTETGALKDLTPTMVPEAPKPEEPGNTLTTKPDEKPAPAPTVYEFKLPEGTASDPKFLEKVSGVFKEAGVSAESAQKIVDFYFAEAKAAAAEPQKQYETMRNEWRDSIVKDTKYGDGSSLRPEIKATIGRALDAIGDQKLVGDFRAAMDLTGAGDNPAFIKAFYALAQKVTEGTVVRGGGPSGEGQRDPQKAPRSAAQAIYPNLPSSNA